MTLNILSKLRKELYIISEIEDFEDPINSKSEENEAILKFLKILNTLRNKNEDEIIGCFIPLLEYDKIIAFKTLFFIRDKICGKGERRVFRVLIKYLAFNEGDLLVKYLPLISKYGRFDDYYSLFYTPLENDVINIFKKQISIDLNSKNPSKLGKWLKSENTSSKNSRKLAFRTRKLLCYTSQEYRLILSSLRKKIGVIERKLSLKDFDSIDYNKLSIDVCLRYKNSFIENDRYRYIRHIRRYNKNKSSKLYSNNINNINQTPFNIIELIINKNISGEVSSIYNKLWNVVCDNYKSIYEDTYIILAMSHKSREVNSKAYKVALSTVLFCNRFNSSIYKNYYTYFKNKPCFGKINDDELVGKVNSIKNRELYDAANIESALDLLLFTSIKKELSNDQMPKNIMIISDLDLEKKYKETNNIQLLKNKWALSGYLVPKLKFWQIEDGVIDKGISKDVYSNIFAKGYSREIFISLLKEEIITSEDLILNFLESDRYNDIY